MDKLVEHLRLIHFSILATSATAIYIALGFGFDVGTFDDEVQKIADLREELVSTSSSADDYWRTIAPALYRQSVATVLRATQDLVPRSKPEVDETAFLKTYVSHFVPGRRVALGSLEGSWAQISGGTWNVELVTSLSIAPPDQAKALETLKTSTCSVVVTSFQKVARDQFDLGIRASCRRRDDRRSEPRESTAQVRATAVLSKWKMGITWSDFKAMFPTATSVWPSVKDVDQKKLHQAAERLLGIRLQKREVAILGIPVELRHVGVCTPIVVVALLIYLFTYLGSYDAAEADDRRLWILGASPVLFGLATLAVMPALATYLALADLAASPAPFPLLGASLVVCLGLSCELRVTRTSGKQS